MVAERTARTARPTPGLAYQRFLGVWLAWMCLGQLSTPVMAESSLAERRASIQRLSVADKQLLARKLARFQELEPSEQKRIRALHASLTAHPDRERLSRVMENYHHWLGTLSTELRAELNALEPAQRIPRIKSLLARQAARLAKETAKQGPDVRQSSPPASTVEPLSSSDRDVLASWMEKVGLEMLPSERKAYIQALSPENRRRAVFGALVQRWQGLGPTKSAKVKEEAWQELRGMLSPEAMRRLAARDTPEAKQQLLHAWVQQTLEWYEKRHGTLRQPMISDQRLRNFFEQELTESERQQLLGVPEPELRRRLKRLFRQHHRELFEPRGSGPSDRSRRPGVDPARPNVRRIKDPP